MASKVVALLLVLSLSAWNMIPAVEASLVTVPASVGNMLIANVGERISLTCTHEVAGTGVTNTIWNITAPIGCLVSLTHLAGALHANCGPFSFEDVSTMSPFTSTAVANATLSNTGSVVQCVSAADVMLIGQTTLCIVDVPQPPQNFRCLPMSGGMVQCSWDAVDQDCAMDDILYSLVITDSDGNVTNATNTTSTMETFALMSGQDYNATLVIIMGDRQSDSADTQFRPQDIVTSPTSATTTSEQTPAPQGGIPSYVWIIIVVVIAFAAGVIVGILLIVFRKRIFRSCYEGGKDNTDGIALKQSSGHDSIKHEQAPSGEEYAVVDATGRSKATEDLGSFYQDPKAIEHEEAPTGDLYAVTEKKPKKGSKKGPSEDELAQMYAQPDKSKKNQLTYADIDVTGGSGGAPLQQQLEYATVVN